MKISKLIIELINIMARDGDLDVWVDSTNELSFGEIKNIYGKDYSGRQSNNNPHCYLDVEVPEN